MTTGTTSPQTVLIDHDGPITIITLNRPEVRNAVDGRTARLLDDAFEAFDADDRRSVAILTGSDGVFCSGADLRGVDAGHGNEVRLHDAGEMVDSFGPMGPTRRMLSKPVLAAVEGYAVAGGLELSLWCDLRVASRTAAFGVFCRRWGVPLVDGGTIRLPRLIGHGRALDLILTGREVDAREALEIGLVNRVCEPGEALSSATALAHELASLPQRCLRSDRLSSYRQWDLELGAALANETELGLDTIRSGETAEGTRRFTEGAGRGGAPA